MNREDLWKRRWAWQQALYSAANEMPENAPLRKILGSVAWGRFEGESQAGELKDHISFGCGYLQGVRDTALRAGRELSLKGTRSLEGIHDRVRKNQATL